jgi:hypothetical protein
VIEDAVRSHAWIFDALGELVAATPSTPRRPQREDIRRALRPRFVWLRRSGHYLPWHLDAAFGLASGTVPMWRLPQDNCKRPLIDSGEAAETAELSFI